MEKDFGLYWGSSKIMFKKISQNFVKSPLKFCLISQVLVHNLWHVWKWVSLCILFLYNSQFYLFLNVYLWAGPGRAGLGWVGLGWVGLGLELNSQENTIQVILFFCFFFIWILWPFQEYFSYIEWTVHQRWAKTGEPMVKNIWPWLSHMTRARLEPQLWET